MSCNKSTPTAFIATVYGNLTPLNNSTFSQARLRIFYKGKNRNGSYITDEVADAMLSTLPGTPIVGYFDADKGDFLGHVSKESARAYGFVPDANNFEWETHLDNDGVYRTYACCDVVLWTGRYPVAKQIVGKNHSMELNPDNVDGEWVVYDDEYYFQFSKAEFLGLCILGDEYEPCFEGSSFFELRNANNTIKDDLTEMFSLYKSAINISNENPTGGNTMKVVNNENLTSNETEVVVEETISEQPAENKEEAIVEETAAADVVEENEESTNETEVTEENENCAADPVETENVINSEKNEEVTDVEETEEEVEEEVEEESQSEEENSEEESTEDDSKEDDKPIDSNVETNAALIAAKDEEIASLKAQLEELKQYKAVKIKEEKETILNNYSSKLTEEEIENFKSIMDNFEQPIDFKKEIALCILDKEDTVATNNSEENTASFALVQNQKAKLTGAEAIIAQYVNKK